MGYTSSKLVVEPFENSIGQLINPGDKVVAVTTGYGHRVSVFTGVFAGVRRDKYNDKIVGTSVHQVPDHYTKIEYVDDGEFEEERYTGWNRDTGQYIYEKTGRRYNKVPVERYRKSALQLNRVFKVDTPISKIKRI